MSRYLLCTLILVTLTALVSFPTSISAQEDNPNVQVTQIDTSNYPEITLYVSVTETQGRPVAGLNQSDFAVTEDGTPISISTFNGGGSTQIHTTLIIDRSGSMNKMNKLWKAKEAAQTFIAQMKPNDQTMLIAFNQWPELLQPFTNNHQMLNEAIDNLNPSGGTAIYDSIIEGVDSLNTLQGRRVLILLTDGYDCRDPMAGQCSGSFYSQNEAIDHANQYDQPVYIVGLGHADTINEPVLQNIANDTRGEYFHAPQADQLIELYSRLASNLQEEYVLTYTSPRPFYDGTRRDIQVSVGTTTSTSRYTEHHLINVQSNAFIGLALLLPLLGLLALPAVAQRSGWRKHQNTPTPGSTNVIDTPNPGAIASVPSESQPAGQVTAIEPDTHQKRFCTTCGESIRPQARFCGTCGAPQNIPYK